MFVWIRRTSIYPRPCPMRVVECRMSFLHCMVSVPYSFKILTLCMRCKIWGTHNVLQFVALSILVGNFLYSFDLDCDLMEYLNRVNEDRSVHTVVIKMASKEKENNNTKYIIADTKKCPRTHLHMNIYTYVHICVTYYRNLFNRATISGKLPQMAFPRVWNNLWPDKPNEAWNRLEATKMQKTHGFLMQYGNFSRFIVNHNAHLRIF